MVERHGGKKIMVQKTWWAVTHILDGQGERETVPRTGENKEHAPMSMLSSAFAVLQTVYPALVLLVN